MVRWDEVNQRWSGKAQVDASDRRVINLPDGSTLNTTLLLRGEFDVLAVNCYAFDKKWHFAFAKNSDLPTSTFRGYTQVQRDNIIASLISVTWPPVPPFYSDLKLLLAEMVAAGEGKDPKEVAAGAAEVVTEENDSEIEENVELGQPKLF